MVNSATLIEAKYGEYSFTAVRNGAAPWPGDDGSTSVRVFAPIDLPDLTIAVTGLDLVPSGGQSVIELPSPILGEDSEVSIYIKGPIPTSITTEPRLDSIRTLFEKDEFQHFQICYSGSVGEVLWTWHTPYGSIRFSLECFPTKLDYRRDFASIREALEKLSPSLTASAAGAAAGRYATTIEWAQSADIEWLQLVRQSHCELKLSMERLVPNLRRQIQVSESLTTRDRMRRARPLSRRSYAPGRPTSTIAVSALEDATTNPINGHLRWELQRLRATAMEVSNAKWFRKLDPNLANPVLNLSEALNTWLPDLSHIPVVRQLPSLQVRLRDPLYESAFRHIYNLRSALYPLRDSYPVGIKDLPTLYEYWVFLRIVEILRERYPIVVENAAPLVRKAGADLILTPGMASTIILSNREGAEVRCQFNKLFTDLPTANQKPDAVVSISGEGKSLVIDAKYRLGRDPRYIRQFGTEGPLAEDINVIHRYRDAIVASEPPHRRLSRAGLIAFPGRTSKRYESHRFYRSWLAVRIGGMPMLPGNSRYMEKAIFDYLNETEAVPVR